MKVQKANKTNLKTVKQSVTLSKQAIGKSKHYLNSKNMQEEESEKEQNRNAPVSALERGISEQGPNDVKHKHTPKRDRTVRSVNMSSASNMDRTDNISDVGHISSAGNTNRTGDMSNARSINNVGNTNRTSGMNNAGSMSNVGNTNRTGGMNNVGSMSNVGNTNRSDGMSNIGNISNAGNENRSGNASRVGNTSRSGNTNNKRVNTANAKKGVHTNRETSRTEVASKSVKTIEKGAKTVEKGTQTVAQSGAGTAAGAAAGAASGGAAVAAKGATSIANKFREYLQNGVDVKTEQLKVIQSEAMGKVANAQVHSFNSGAQFLGNLVVAAAVPLAIVWMNFVAIFAGVMIFVMITVLAIVAVVSILTAMLAMFFATSTSERRENVGLSAQVEEYRPLVREYAQMHGVEEYVPYLLAIMQVESRGNGGDPMQASESQGMAPNTITDPEVSIDAGVRHFANALRTSEAKGADILTTIQAYNFGTGYIDYVVRQGGKHKFEIAEAFSREKANGETVRYSNPIAVDRNGGWRYRYGNMFYVELVNQYIQFASGGSGKVPIYLQGDPAWKGVPYAGTTIGYAGCGLTAAASCFSALTGEEITPLTLQQMVGNSCTVGGVNDMGKFAVFGKNRWGLQHTGALHISRGNIGNMLSQLEQGHFVFASMRGNYPGGVGYIANGHILLLYKEGSAYYMMDPAYAENSREWTIEALNQISWKYCYGIWN